MIRVKYKGVKESLNDFSIFVMFYADTSRVRIHNMSTSDTCDANSIELIPISNKNAFKEKNQKNSFLTEEVLQKKSNQNTPIKLVNAFTNVGYLTSQRIINLMELSNKVNQNIT